jgi:hypothetical protein
MVGAFRHGLQVLSHVRLTVSIAARYGWRRDGCATPSLVCPAWDQGQARATRWLDPRRSTPSRRGATTDAHMEMVER